MTPRIMRLCVALGLVTAFIGIVLDYAGIRSGVIVFLGLLMITATPIIALATICIEAGRKNVLIALLSIITLSIIVSSAIISLLTR